MTKISEFTELQEFFSGYFHEDWPLDAGNADDVVAGFLATGPSADELKKLASQIERFMSSHPKDAELNEALFRELGCYYLPGADGLTTRGWLGGVAKRFLEHVH